MLKTVVIAVYQRRIAKLPLQKQSLHSNDKNAVVVFLDAISYYSTVSKNSTNKFEKNSKANAEVLEQHNMSGMNINLCF